VSRLRKILNGNNLIKEIIDLGSLKLITKWGATLTDGLQYWQCDCQGCCYSKSMSVQKNLK
jgi:hypothetical protein